MPFKHILLIGLLATAAAESTNCSRDGHRLALHHQHRHAIPVANPVYSMTPLESVAMAAGARVVPMYPSIPKQKYNAENHPLVKNPLAANSMITPAVPFPIASQVEPPQTQLADEVVGKHLSSVLGQSMPSPQASRTIVHVVHGPQHGTSTTHSDEGPESTAVASFSQGSTTLNRGNETIEKASAPAKTPITEAVDFSDLLPGTYTTKKPTESPSLFYPEPDPTTAETTKKSIASRGVALPSLKILNRHLWGMVAASIVAIWAPIPRNAFALDRFIHAV